MSMSRQAHELDEFLAEADQVLTPNVLKNRAKDGCEYSSYLQHPTVHHGQVSEEGFQNIRVNASRVLLANTCNR